MKARFYHMIVVAALMPLSVNVLAQENPPTPDQTSAYALCVTNCGSAYNIQAASCAPPAGPGQYEMDKKDECDRQADNDYSSCLAGCG